MSHLSTLPSAVYLVGCGPGDLGLVTLRAQEIITQADHIIYDYLVNPDILSWAKPTAEITYAGKQASRHTLTQDEINQLLITAYASGKIIARLKGGDPYVFGRGGEEAQILAAAGIPFEVVPGISSSIAAPAYAGIPITHRDHASSFTIITGHEDPTKTNSAIDWKQIAQLHGTKIILMGIERLDSITRTLIEFGADPATPVALIRWGSTTRQQTLTGTLSTINDLARSVRFQPPAVCVIGSVVHLRPALNWFEKRPLFGKRIIVTRTRTQASALTSRLRALGAHVLEIPTIRTEPAALTQDQLNRCANLSAHYDWLVFTSPNAVSYFLKIFLRHHPDLRSLGPIKIAAIGTGTAQALAAYHLHTDLMPETFTGEALAQALIKNLPAGTRLLLPRSDLATDTLPLLTTEANLKIDEWTIYHTRPETQIPEHLIRDYQEHGAHWITFTSSSTVRHWLDLKLQPPAYAQPQYASIGPITTATLIENGLPPHIEAATHTIDGLVDALLAKILNDSTLPSP